MKTYPYTKSDFKIVPRYSKIMKIFPILFIVICLVSCTKETAEDYIKKGIVEENKSHFDKAVSFFDVAIKIDSSYADSYYHRGVCYFYMSKPDKALNDYTKAIKLQPTFSDAYQERGSLLFTLGEYELALRDFDYAIKLSPENKDLYSYRALVKKKLSKIPHK